jgi:hypothetical protein
MIRVICPNCLSKLTAKDELVGQVRKCPKCAHPVEIIAPAATEDDGDLAKAEQSGDASPAQESASVSDGLPKPDLPKRLNRENIYLICGRTSLVACWENKGRGWLLKTDAGLVTAKRNSDQLPANGDFKLIELRFDKTPEGRRLVGLRVYQLAHQWAMTVLDQDEDQVMERVVGTGSLNREQKNAVRQALKDQYMRPVWEHATNILEYLGNADYHSSEVA